MKILIADDMKVSRLVLTATLKKLGHEVVDTENGEQALQAFQEGDFPVLITDWQMPTMDGLELCRRVRAETRPRYTYVLMVTALDAKPDYMAAIEAGADDFLIKPLDEDMLSARLLVAQRIGGLLSEVQQRHGLLPICPTCKKICDEHSEWINVEQYIDSHMPAVVSQRQCPRCEDARNANQHSLSSRLNRLHAEAHKTT